MDFESEMDFVITRTTYRRIHIPLISDERLEKSCGLDFESVILASP